MFEKLPSVKDRYLKVNNLTNTNRAKTEEAQDKSAEKSTTVKKKDSSNVMDMFKKTLFAASKKVISERKATQVKEPTESNETCVLPLNSGETLYQADEILVQENVELVESQKPLAVDFNRDHYDDSLDEEDDLLAENDIETDAAEDERLTVVEPRKKARHKKRKDKECARIVDNGQVQRKTGNF